MALEREGGRGLWVGGGREKYKWAWLRQGDIYVLFLCRSFGVLGCAGETICRDLPLSVY